MKRRMRNRTYGVVRGGQGQPNRLLDLDLVNRYRFFTVTINNGVK